MDRCEEVRRGSIGITDAHKRISWAKELLTMLQWVRRLSGTKQRLSASQYDCVILGPGILSAVPDKLLRNSRIMPVRLQPNPASLEAAGIRAGVII